MRLCAATTWAWERRRRAAALCLVVFAPLLGCPVAGGDAGPIPVDAGQIADGGAGRDGGGLHDGGDDAGPPQPLLCPALPAGVSHERLGLSDDTATLPVRRVVLMGGSVEVDAHSNAFVSAAEGGDVLVMRATGSVSTYTPYFYDELNATPAPASSATIRLDEPSAGDDDGVLCRVRAAECLWLAGGDQYNYLGIWPSALRATIAQTDVRGGAVGGTSAGAMALGEYAFDAAEGSVSSAEALTTPVSSVVSVIASPMGQPELSGTIVDTHFSARDREGRLIAFMARASTLANSADIRGIGLDERASLVIEKSTFDVATGASGRFVFFYMLTVMPTLTASSALDVEGVLRRRVSSGSQDTWPPDMNGDDVETIDVVDGVVSLRIAD